jgi:hypothetical protein
MSAALPAKRKMHIVPAVSNVSAATSSKKQKPDLTCTVCGIKATSETAMQEHLKGKSHGKKAAKLAPPLTGAGHHEVKETQYTYFIEATPSSVVWCNLDTSKSHVLEHALSIHRPVLSPEMYISGAKTSSNPRYISCHQDRLPPLHYQY